MSHLEGIINKLVVYIVCIQIILCSFMALSTKLWMKNNYFDDHHELLEDFTEN